MTFSEKMKGLAIKANKKLVLPEGMEKRTVQAARKIKDEGLASAVKSSCLETAHVFSTHHIFWLEILTEQHDAYQSISPHP